MLLAMKPPAVLLIGKSRAEATLASAALYCAGARIVTAKPDLALLVEVKASGSVPARLKVPLVAIVRPGDKRKALQAGVDAAYARPAQWKAYSRLVERVLAEWAPTRKGARPRRARSS
jgi:ABC-type amino acid transport substrate-binding protein